MGSLVVVGFISSEEVASEELSEEEAFEEFSEEELSEEELSEEACCDASPADDAASEEESSGGGVRSGSEMVMGTPVRISSASTGTSSLEQAVSMTPSMAHAKNTFHFFLMCKFLFLWLIEGRRFRLNNGRKSYPLLYLKFPSFSTHSVDFLKFPQIKFWWSISCNPRPALQVRHKTQAHGRP